MPTLTTDQKYKELVEELDALNDKFDKFIHGKSDETVYLEPGRNIKTLSGTLDDLNSFKYVQRVLEHRLYADMIDDLSIENGILVRVWGDEVLVNGLYMKSESGFSKISYSELYDLIPITKPNWNEIKVDLEELDQLVYSIKVPKSALTTNSSCIDGKVVLTSGDSNQLVASGAFDFRLICHVGKASNSSVIELDNFNSVYVNNSSTELIVTKVDGIFETRFDLRLNPYTISDQIIPTKATISLYTTNSF